MDELLSLIRENCPEETGGVCEEGLPQFEYASVKGWDGEGSEPVSAKSLDNARLFLKSGFVFPEIFCVYPLPCGAVMVEWHYTNRVTASIIFYDKKGSLHIWFPDKKSIYKEIVLCTQK